MFKLAQERLKPSSTDVSCEAKHLCRTAKCHSSLGDSFFCIWHSQTQGWGVLQVDKSQAAKINTIIMKHFPQSLWPLFSLLLLCLFKGYMCCTHLHCHSNIHFSLTQSSLTWQYTNPCTLVCLCRYTEHTPLGLAQQWDQLDQLAMRMQHNLEQQIQARYAFNVTKERARRRPAESSADTTDDERLMMIPMTIDAACGWASSIAHLSGAFAMLAHWLSHYALSSAHWTSYAVQAMHDSVRTVQTLCMHDA